MTPETLVVGINSNLKPMKTWRLIKNLFIIGVAFMIHFTAFNGVINLQISINAEDGLGSSTLAVMYVSIIVSNMFLPEVFIKWLGTKRTISLSFISYMPYITAQLYPNFYTMIPAGIILGLGAGPLWCASNTYISVCAKVHSRISKESVEALLARFFGIFFMIYQLHQIIGNLISSLVLTSGNNSAAATSLNETMIPILCGANFVPNKHTAKAFRPQPPEKIQLLTGIYLANMAGAALIVVIGADSMKRYECDHQESAGRLSGMALLGATMKLMVEPTQLLLVTISIFDGLQQAYIGAEFAAAFVSCAIGTGYVGFVMMAFGLFNVMGSVLSGYLVKVIGRRPIFCVGTIVHSSLLCTIALWHPHAGYNHILYIMAVFWGICDSIWQVQIKSLYGTLFIEREAAAYSNYQIWQAIGFIIMYALSPYLKTSYKSYLMFMTMIIGILCYFIVEYQQYVNKKKQIRKNDPACVELMPAVI